MAGLAVSYYGIRPQDKAPALPKTKFQQAAELEAQAKAAYEDAAELREQGMEEFEVREQKFERLLDFLIELFPDKFGTPEPDTGGEGKSSGPKDRTEEE